MSPVQSLNPAAGPRIGFPGHATTLALAFALLALSLGLLMATITGPQGDESRAVDGWRRLMSADLRALLVFAIPCSAWLLAVVTFVRNSPVHAAVHGRQQTHPEHEPGELPSVRVHDHTGAQVATQIRKSFHDALREDRVGLALSRPVGRQTETAHADKEDDEMLKRRMAVMALTAVGTISACDSTGAAPPPVSQAVAEQSRRETSRLDGEDSEVKVESRPDPAVYRASYHDCTEASNGTTADMMDCIGDEFEYQDGRLNATYRRLREMLSPKASELLRNEQRTWLANLEASCIPDEEIRGGTAGMLVAEGCRLELTTRRADELDQLERTVKPKPSGP